MNRTSLLKRVEHIEIWETTVDRVQVFAVKFHPKRARIARSLAHAEALLREFLGRSRLARSH